VILVLLILVVGLSIGHLIASQCIGFHFVNQAPESLEKVEKTLAAKGIDVHEVKIKDLDSALQSARKIKELRGRMQMKIFRHS